MSLLLAAYPLVGLALGALGAVAAAAAGALAPAFAGLAGVLALEGAKRVRPRWATVEEHRLPGALAAGLVAAKLLAAAGVPGPALGTALVLAAMLGRWAVVVLCYGGAAAAGAAEDTLPARAGFGEFGWASLTAFAVTLSAAEAIGLLILLIAVLVTLAARVWWHRHAGGMTASRVSLGAELVETAVLGSLALLATIF